MYNNATIGNPTVEELQDLQDVIKSNIKIMWQKGKTIAQISTDFGIPAQDVDRLLGSTRRHPNAVIPPKPAVKPKTSNKNFSKNI